MNYINNQIGSGLEFLGTIRKYISKGFLTIIVICTIVYLTLLINKNKCDKKYFIALIAVFAFTLLASWCPLSLTLPLIIIKIILLLAPLITMLILNILIGEDKY
jgi:hypothetical protein